MKFILFIDESGHHDLKTYTANDCHLAICGVLFSNPSYRKIDKDLKDFKTTCCGSTDIILHSRDIRRKTGSFTFLENKFSNERFLATLGNLLENNRYRVICPIINKKGAVDTYAEKCQNVYHTAVTFLLERVVYCLQEFGDIDKELTIIVESRNKKEDNRLRKHIFSVFEHGTFYVRNPSFTDLKMQLFFNTKTDNINGLQLADLFAWPIMRKVLKPDEPNIPFDIIFEKIHKKRGNPYGCGIKIFP